MVKVYYNHQRMKRRLTTEEINFILDEIHPIAGLEKTIAARIHDRMRRNMRAQLEKCEMYSEKIPELKAFLTKQYYQSQITPGVSVGIATSQSIGERQTQLALNSFHSTGMTTMTVVAGVPRFNELVNATKNPKSVISNIYFHSRPTTIVQLREFVPDIKQVFFEQIIQKHGLHREVHDKWYSCFEWMYPDIFQKKSACDALVRFQCNHSTLFHSRLHLREIADTIHSQMDGIICVWSPDEMGILDIWFSTTSLQSRNGQSPDITIHLFVDEILLPQLKMIQLKGIGGIEEVDFAQDKSEWHLDALGYNLQQLYQLPVVDETRTVSNHMWEIYQVLGVEAVREFLIHEFTQVISVESYINPRHIQLLVDVMLFTGDISSISRYGVHKNQSGALTKCSFEESLDQILKAGIYGENEQINGVSGAIITGKLSNIGTGLCDLVYQPNI